MAVTFRYLEGRAAPVPRKSTSSTSLSACMHLYFTIPCNWRMCSRSEMTIIDGVVLLSSCTCPREADILSYLCVHMMQKEWRDPYRFNAGRHIAVQSFPPFFWQLQSLEYLWMIFSQAALRS